MHIVLRYFTRHAFHLIMPNMSCRLYATRRMRHKKCSNNKWRKPLRPESITPIIKQLFQKLVRLFVDFIYNELVEKLTLQCCMEELMKRRKIIPSFPSIFFVIDIACQKYTSVRVIRKRQRFSQWQTQLNCRTMEVLVLPIELVLSLRKWNLRSASDITIMNSAVEVLVDYFQKSTIVSSLFRYVEYAQRFARFVECAIK